MLKVIQVGMVEDHFWCQSGKSLTYQHRLCLGFDIVWNVQSASLGMWSRAVRMRMARTCCPRSRAAGMSTPCTADAKQRRAGGSPASSRAAKFQRRLLSAATERLRRSRWFVRRSRNGPWTRLDISEIGSRRRSGENSHPHDAAAVLTRSVFYHRLHEITQEIPGLVPSVSDSTQPMPDTCLDHLHEIYLLANSCVVATRPLLHYRIMEAEM